MTRMASRAVWIGLLALLLAPRAQAQETWTGKVVGVYDGDTLLVRKGNGSVVVRLHGVDAPEWSQRYGQTAASWVAQQLLYEQVDLVAFDRDQYGRYVCNVTMPNGDLLNTELLRRGYAWVYSVFVGWNEYYAWIRLVRTARDAHDGLWHDQDPTPPWVWRRSHPH